MDMYQKRKMRAENKNMEEENNKTNINWYPGHMVKTKREIKERINLIDIVIELIDSRVPYSSKNKEIDELVGSKPRLLIMTKKDLCDKEETNKWIKYYESKGYHVLLFDLINDNIKLIFEKINILTKDINEKRKNKGLKERKVRALIVGVPNVGKSTLINKIVGKKATNVGNKPGITKHLEWIRINDKLELLDTPGILWPRLGNEDVALNLASTTAIKEEILNLDEVAIHIINKLIKYYKDNLEERYNIKVNEDIVVILDDIGKKIGAYRNNDTDYDKVYLKIFRDLRDGYFKNITLDRYEEIKGDDNE